MYNNFLYNQNLYSRPFKSVSWWGGEWGWIDIIWFNWYNFSDIIISNIPDDYAWNSINLETYQLSTHGEWYWNWIIKNKTLTIKWWIVWENKSELERKIKKIKTNILCWESNLFLKRSDWILQTKAVVTNFSLPKESWTINSIAISVTFTVLDPFFYSLEKHELAFYWINSDFYTSLFYETGSHSAKVWLFVMFGSWTSVTSVDIMIWEKLIRVNESFIAWDILFLDWENIDVAKNWTYGIDWIWEIGELSFWENSIIVTANWNANYSVFIQYRDTYV